MTRPFQIPGQTRRRLDLESQSLVVKDAQCLDRLSQLGQHLFELFERNADFDQILFGKADKELQFDGVATGCKIELLLLGQLFHLSNDRLGFELPHLFAFLCRGVTTGVAIMDMSDKLLDLVQIAHQGAVTTLSELVRVDGQAALVVEFQSQLVATPIVIACVGFRDGEPAKRS